LIFAFANNFGTVKVFWLLANGPKKYVPSIAQHSPVHGSYVTLYFAHDPIRFSQPNKIIVGSLRPLKAETHEGAFVEGVGVLLYEGFCRGFL